MLIVVMVVVLITGSSNPFASKSTIYTYLADAASLSAGAPVNLNGIPIGSVKDIGLSGSKQPNRIVRIDMEIPSDKLKLVPNDSLVAIGAPNVLGTKFINITIGKSTVPVKPHEELPSASTAEFEDLIKKGYTVMSSLQLIVDKVDRIVSQVENGQGSIGKLLVDPALYNRILAIADSVQKLADALNSNQGTFGKLIYDRDLYDQLQTSLGRVDSMLKDVQAGQGTAGKLLKDPTLYNDTEKTVAELRQMAADLNAGKGTAGKLLKSDELHRQLLITMGKVDTLMDKVNSGQGTIGQLLVNPSMYDNLNGTTRELHELLKDFRANPKKFLRIKLSLF